MLKRIICLFKGHDWQIVQRTDYRYRVVMCTKCGKIKTWKYERNRNSILW